MAEDQLQTGDVINQGQDTVHGQDMPQSQDAPQEQNPPDKIGKLYSTLSTKLDLGDESTFRQKMQKQSSRDKLYSVASKYFDLGSIQKFNDAFTTQEPLMHSIGGKAPVQKPISNTSGLAAPQQQVAISESTKTPFTVDQKQVGLNDQEQLSFQNKMQQLKQQQEQKAKESTALSKMSAQGIPNTPANLSKAIAGVNTDIANGNLSLTHDKDGNPVYGRNASFLQSVDTGFMQTIESMKAAVPIIWYSQIDKDPTKLVQAINEHKDAMDFIKNNPQTLSDMMGAVPGANMNLNTSGEPMSYSSLPSQAGQMIGSMIPQVAATALVPGSTMAADGVGIMASAANDLLGKTAVAGLLGYANSHANKTVELYDENVQKGMSPTDAAVKAQADASVQALPHAAADAVFYGGLLPEAQAAQLSEKASAGKAFLQTVLHSGQDAVKLGAIGGGLQGIDELLKKSDGYDTRDAGKHVLDAAIGMAAQSAVFGLLPILGKAIPLAGDMVGSAVQAPKYLVSAAKEYINNNISSPVLTAALHNLPNAAEISNALDTWKRDTEPLRGVVPDDKIPSIGGVIQKSNNLKSDALSLEASKATLPEALHPTIDAQIQDKNSQIDAANTQVAEMVKSNNPMDYEYDDMTGKPVIPKTGGISVQMPGEKEVTTSEGKEVPTEPSSKGVSVTLPETNKTADQIPLIKKQNEEPQTQETESPKESVSVQSETNPPTSEKQPVEEPKSAGNVTGFSALRERKSQEPQESVQSKEPIYKQLERLDEPITPKDQALAYFAGGGKVHDDSLNELFDNSKGELKSKAFIKSKKTGKTIDQIAHSMWDNQPEDLAYTTQDFRDAIEDVLRTHNSRGAMARELLERNTVPEQHIDPNMSDVYFIGDKMYDKDGNEMEEAPFQVKTKPTQDLEDMKVAVKEQMDKGITKLSDIQKVAKEQLGDIPEYINHPDMLRNLVEEAFHEVGKENTPKEITHGVVGAVSKWLDKTLGGTKKKVSVLSNNDSMLSKLKGFNNEPQLHLDEKGEVLGFAHEGKIYLNAEHLNPNTPIHEAGHIWTQWAKDNASPMYQKGMQLVEKSKYLDKVSNNEFYKKEASRIGDEGSFKYNEYLKHEALAMAIGDKGAQFVTEAKKASFKEWAQRLWNKVARTMGVKDVKPEEIQNLTFKQLTKGIAKDILEEGTTAKMKEERVDAREGVSHESLNASAKEMGHKPIERGGVLSPEEYADRGRELLKGGVDPDTVFESGMPLYDKIAVARAYQESLRKEWLGMTKAEQLSEKGIALSDKYRYYAEDVAKKLGTEWGGAGRALQGDRNLNTDDFLTVSSNMSSILDKPLDKETLSKIRDLTDEVQASKDKIGELQKELIRSKDKEFSEVGGEEVESKPKSTRFKDSAKKIADAVRKIKQKPFQFKDADGHVVDFQKMGIGWNELVELGAKAIEKTGELADGIAAIIDKIKDGSYYKGLSDADKVKLENDLHDHFSSNIVKESPEAKNIRRLEKQLSDLQNGIVKEKGLSREASPRELELKEQIAKEKERLGLSRKSKEPKEVVEAKTPKSKQEQLQDMFADKKGNQFSYKEAKAIWEYTKEQYLGKDMDYGAALAATANDLGLTFDQVNHAISTPKAKPITDKIWMQNRDLRAKRTATETYVRNQTTSAIVRGFYKVTAIPRAIATFAHAGVFVGTHAKRAFANPVYTRKVIRAFFNGYKLGYGSTVGYEMRMAELKNDRNYDLAQMSGLRNNPDQIRNIDSEITNETYFGSAKSKLKWFNESGTRGFNAIKILRQEMFNAEFDRLPKELQNNPEMLKKLAALVNVSTGGTNLKIPEWTNKVMFSSGLEANRWESIIKQPANAISVILKGNKATQAEKYALKVYSRNLGIVTAMYLSTVYVNSALNSMFFPGEKDKEVNEFDPTGRNWMRYNINGHVTDMTGGITTTIAFISKLIATAYDSENKGRILSREGDIAGRYGLGKLSPLYSIGAEIATRHDYSGNTVPWSDQKPQHGYNHKMNVKEYLLSKSPLPIAEAARTYYDSAQKQGASEHELNNIGDAALEALISGGAGVTYFKNEPSTVTNKSRKQNRRQRRKKRGE